MLPRTPLARYQVLQGSISLSILAALYDALVFDNKPRPMRSLLSHPDE
jgi:hypothetical protein